MTYKSEFLQTIEERGFIHQLSHPQALDERLCEGPITAYIGFDCTADSLHVGSLVQIMLLYWLQQTGHRPIALMGSGTTRVGDPSGKDEMRKMLTDEVIESNKTALQRSFAKLIKFGDGPTDAIMADNADWLLDLKLLEFLREYGRHFSINEMIKRDSVQTRLEREQHMSLLEFNYSVFQAYDFFELNKRYGCQLQLGGSDQWGNIISGVDFGRRASKNNYFAATTPLIATASGVKMGKTMDGAIWLNPDRLDAYPFWQFWRNVDDADVGRFFRLFTTLPMSEIARIEKCEGAELNEAKALLATTVTATMHDQASADRAAQTAKATFEEGAIDLSLPSVVISKSDLNAGIGVLNAAVLSGLAGSNGEARRMIKSGALKLNDNKVEDERSSISEADLLAEGVIKISSGKKRHILLRPE
ncbi:tyrosine--tRNA ligase [Maritalea sp.]|uniref:tyrosine--tRNA ligase n=1 Tax=Maritalea sp. TaxID=2003361 RepID=UPI003EF6C261